MVAAAVHHHVITSIDELSERAPAARTLLTPLRPVTISAERGWIETDGVIVDVAGYSFPWVTHGETAAGRLGFLTPLGHQTGQFNGEPLLPTMLHSYGERAELLGWTHEPLFGGTLSIARDALEDAAAALDVDIDPPDSGDFRLLRARDQHRLRFLFERTLSLARLDHGRTLDPRTAHELRETARELAVRAFETGASMRALSSAHINSMHITRQCEEYAEATRYHDVTMTELCRATGVSERRVRQAFYDAYGMSPTAYLRIAALYELRRALREVPQTRDAVSRAAADLGFWHLGHLARQYRALFGENPSDTVADRLAAAAGA